MDRHLRNSGNKGRTHPPADHLFTPCCDAHCTANLKFPDLSGAALAKTSYRHAQRHWQQGSYCRMLARMLFGAAVPDQRHRILERFYRLPQGLIERFHTGRSARRDAVRILARKPPVPIRAAIAALSGHGRPLTSREEAR
ncbi:MAG: hypothetical protein KUG65_02195 [Sphingomonadaceae bacterium]|nr:hypothetical protein [Sphingomonadaceae bacterium]